MDLFGRPNIEKMISENDREGLYQCLDHRDRLVRLRAAQALAELSDGAGWRMLSEWVQDDSDPDIQEASAAILAELGARSPGDAHRAIPALGQALKTVHDETAAVIRDALLQIGGPEAEQALSEAGYTPSSEEPVSELSDFEAHYVRPVLLDTQEIEFLTAENHLNTAVDLRESEFAERALVECSLALWLRPDWAYAWYLRGVLFEDLDRPYEAWLSYTRALQIDPRQADSLEALADLEDEFVPLPLELTALAEAAGSLTWQDRRDAAAGLAALAQKDPGLVSGSTSILASLVEDDERDVRYPAIQALGYLGDPSLADTLVNRQETSWLLRFAIIEALSRLKSFEGLNQVLQAEMTNMMDRNPSFSSNKDPLIEVEYERLMEVGVLALEHTGDLESLLGSAEDNAWEEVDEEEITEYEPSGEVLNTIQSDPDGQSPDDAYEDDDFEADEDLSSYVDEVAHMVCMALDRLARPRLTELDAHTLDRLANVPDLTLVDLEQWEQIEEVAEEPVDPPTALVYDLSGLREAAQAEINRRGGLGR